MKILSKKRRFILLFLFLVIAISASPQLFHKNKLPSKSIGKVNSGQIENAWLLPRKGENYKFFSWFSYYILGRAFAHADVYNTIVSSYEELAKANPEIKFRYMECSRKNGGRAWPHRTHQNGLSADFMTPLKKKGKQKLTYDRIGMLRYAMNFEKNGQAKINKKVSIDFDLMAQHILTLNESAKKNNLQIKKVIWNTHLRDELFNSKHGKQLKATGIYFTRNLSTQLNRLHDDHYHIDFEPI